MDKYVKIKYVFIYIRYNLLKFRLSENLCFIVKAVTDQLKSHNQVSVQEYNVTIFYYFFISNSLYSSFYLSLYSSLY